MFFSLTRVFQLFACLINKTLFSFFLLVVVFILHFCVCFTATGEAASQRRVGRSSC